MGSPQKHGQPLVISLEAATAPGDNYSSNYGSRTRRGDAKSALRIRKSSVIMKLTPYAPRNLPRF